MIVTEKSARHMACCGTPAITKYKEGLSPTCEGPDCMAWIWIDPETKREVVISQSDVAKEAGIPWENAAPITKDVPFPNRRGTCGLLANQGVVD